MGIFAPSNKKKRRPASQAQPGRQMFRLQKKTCLAMSDACKITYVCLQWGSSPSALVKKRKLQNTGANVETKKREKMSFQHGPKQ